MHTGKERRQKGRYRQASGGYRERRGGGAEREIQMDKQKDRPVGRQVGRIAIMITDRNEDPKNGERFCQREDDVFSSPAAGIAF